MDEDKIFPAPATVAKGPVRLVEVAAIGDRSEVQVIIQKYPDWINITYGGNTALQKAAYFGHLEVVKFLCSHGADVDMVDGLKRTPLHFAAFGGREDVVKYLLDMKANMHLMNSNGQTPLQVALTKKHSGCIDIFYKADPSLLQGVNEVKPESLCTAGLLFGSDNVGCLGGCGIGERVTFQPCGHQIFCFECSVKRKVCTHCRKAVEKITLDTKMTHVKSLMQELSNLRSENAKYRQDLKCSICEENRKDCVLRPCSHVFCCQCVDKFKEDNKCPNCRKTISEVIKLYM